MKKHSLFILLMMIIAVPALASGPVSSPAVPGVKKIQPQVNSKAVKKLKQIRPYQVSIGYSTVENNSQGDWIYTVSVRNQGTDTVPANTLELVLLRKHSGGETLLDTQTIDEPLRNSGPAVVVSDTYSRCCTNTLVARIRVRGTRNILVAKEFMGPALRTMTVVGAPVINAAGDRYTARIRFPGNSNSNAPRRVIFKTYGGKTPNTVLLSEKEVLIAKGERDYNGTCPGLKSGDYLKIMIYLPTTCVEPEGSCLIAQGGVRYTP